MCRLAMAVAAHPDDIEFMMAGTLILLGEAGYELHYMTIANGSCGSMTMDAPETIAVRGEEAKAACKMIGATHHPPYVDDIELVYDTGLIRKLCAVVREVNPQILLLPSPQDYMEDHMNASRLMVTAAFCRNMRNYETDPPTPLVESDVALYHALPYGLTDQLRQPIVPDFFIDTSSVLEKKRDMLAYHTSQRQWLDDSQGVDNYLKTMEDMSSTVGAMSGKFAQAEGWRRHSHLGFGPEDFDPLRVTLRNYVAENRRGDA